MSLDTQLASWPVNNAAAAVIRPHGVETIGDVNRPFELASVTKLMTSMAALVAHEEGTLDLDVPIAENRGTAADLLAHSTGKRRAYSSEAYDDVAAAIATNADMSFVDYLSDAVFAPLGMTMSALPGPAGSGAIASVLDLIALIRAWREPLLVHRSTLARATTPHRPELGGILPGYGRQEPNLWGIGPEIRGEKSPHWTGAHNSPSTYGHFGQSGTMLWIDPVNDVGVVALTDEPFGQWAVDAWPAFSDAALGW